jgi:ankyrin repeat protein
MNPRTYSPELIDQFYRACRYGEKIEPVQSMIDTNGSQIVTARNTRAEGCTSLHSACKRNNQSLELVQCLVNIGGENLVSAADKYGKTALHYAISREPPLLDIVQYLVGIGGKGLVSVADKCGITALRFACSREHPSLELVQYLVGSEGKALASAADKYGNTTLHYACSREFPSLKLVQYLVGIGGKALASAADGNGKTALHRAFQGKYPSFPMIKLLIETGGCSDWHTIARLIIQRDYCFRDTAVLHLAIATGAPPNVLSDLINHFNECIDVINSTNGRHLMHTAIEAGLSWKNGTQMIVEHIGEDGIIDNIDPVTDLYPFMLAAAGDNYDVSSVYELLCRDTKCCVAQTISYLQ